ncbi:hypothetical protein HK405_006591 [Cladochytrium tenue]|nr:hypothetical protein HK405_006591 [Cladochytrium tenue]
MQERLALWKQQQQATRAAASSASASACIASKAASVPASISSAAVIARKARTLQDRLHVNGTVRADPAPPSPPTTSVLTVRQAGPRLVLLQHTKARLIILPDDASILGKRLVEGPIVPDTSSAAVALDMNETAHGASGVVNTKDGRKRTKANETTNHSYYGRPSTPNSDRALTDLLAREVKRRAEMEAERDSLAAKTRELRDRMQEDEHVLQEQRAAAAAASADREAMEQVVFSLREERDALVAQLEAERLYAQKSDGAAAGSLPHADAGGSCSGIDLGQRLESDDDRTAAAAVAMGFLRNLMARVDDSGRADLEKVESWTKGLQAELRDCYAALDVLEPMQDTEVRLRRELRDCHELIVALEAAGPGAPPPELSDAGIQTDNVEVSATSELISNSDSAQTNYRLLRLAVAVREQQFETELAASRQAVASLSTELLSADEAYRQLEEDVGRIQAESAEGIARVATRLRSRDDEIARLRKRVGELEAAAARGG